MVDHATGPTQTATALRSRSTPPTGVITVADTTNLDRETTVTYNLGRAGHRHQHGRHRDDHDHGTDVSPTVTDTSASLSEAATNGNTVVDVDNTGDDDSVSWSITTNGADADSDDRSFAIDSATEAITVADSGDLDYETTTSYNLVVRPRTPTRRTPRRSRSRYRRRMTIHLPILLVLRRNP